MVDFIDGLPLTSGATNPLDFIDKLYFDIINKIHLLVLPTTLLVLRACAVCPPLLPLHLAYLLGLDMWVFYCSLHAIYSIIKVPSENKIAEDPLKYFHASFPNFLLNPSHSAHLSQDANYCHLQLVQSLFCTNTCDTRDLACMYNVPDL